MTRVELLERVRSYTRDFSNTVFRNVDIYNFINEGIDRFRQYIPHLKSMKYLVENTDEPILLPKEYHALISLYVAARCFEQDERHYQATTRMNEFETKLDELKTKIEIGDIVIIDDEGLPVDVEYKTDYVVNNYFLDKRDIIDFDKGVEGFK